MRTKFENILTDFEIFTKILPKHNEPKTVQFCFPNSKCQIGYLIINKIIASYPDVSFFKTTDNQLTIIGINSSLNLQSSAANYFADISDIFNHWKINFTNNWNEINKSTAPIIFCSARFDPNNSSKLWEEFDPLKNTCTRIYFGIQ